MDNSRSEEDDETPRIILPNMGQLTYKITSFLRSKINCRFGYIPGKKLRNSLCNHKERKSKPDIGVYQIPCSCENLYIGETSRPLEERTKEHSRDLRLKNENSALFHHIQQHPDHVINPESATLIDREPRYFARKFKESLWIRKGITRLNRDNGIEISPVWTDLLYPLMPPVPL